MFLLPILAAATALPSIFGQPIGQPPAFPKCVAQMNLDGPPCMMGKETVEFPLQNGPDLLKPRMMFLRIIDGNVEGMTFGVVGHYHRQQVISLLSSKFGRPTSMRSEPVDPSGILVHETVATWIRAGISVKYDSIDGDMEHGNVRIESPAARSSDAAKASAAKAAQIKL